MRIAAVDYGRRRVGLAVCDPLRITVRGLCTVTQAPRGGASTLAAVAAALRGERVERVVVGLPLHDDGSESAMSREAREFGRALAAALGVPVVWHDEGLTSWEAEEHVKSRGKRLRKARDSGEVDRLAAMSILRSYLRSLEARPPPPP